MTRSGSKKATRQVLFISHYAKEKEVALELQKTLATAFLGTFDVFVSSDTGSITMGADFDVSIRDALKRAFYGLCLFTPESLNRPWINIEFGALWYAEKPAVPICFGGQSVGTLPPPYGGKNGLDATDVDALNKLKANMARALGIEPPTIDWTSFISVVDAFNDRAAHPWQGTEAERQLFIALYNDVHEPEVREPFNPQWDQVDIPTLAKQLTLTPQQVEDAFESLVEQQLIEGNVGYGGALTALDWTRQGWAQYVRLVRTDWPKVQQRIRTALHGLPGQADAMTLAEQLQLGYWPVALALFEWEDAGLMRLSESSAGLSVVWRSPSLARPDPT
ncbi:toll/interleukin-1 receptor domain-containing protein [Deinococcus sp. ME38]|uniref:toll/interleukin-1 receptor domain-containing protein n=1 Tax=Deinococcus sp. ME38 TaxID=3400344 RepID=UPI003B596933